jgi:hypothetical protein
VSQTEPNPGSRVVAPGNVEFYLGVTSMRQIRLGTAAALVLILPALMTNAMAQGRMNHGGGGGGGGGGASVTAIGFIEVRDDSAEFKRISTPMDWAALVAAASIAVLTLKRLFD